MDYLSNLKPASGSVRKPKRIGRGQGSGHGGTSTQGHKGQHSRAGAKFKTWFEGGQMPLSRRVPKFGFTKPHRVEFQVLNVKDIEEFIKNGKVNAVEITPESLFKSGIISKRNSPLKVLGEGELKTKINIAAHSFSKSAKEKIEALGGQVKIIE
jgi:large subunit ribosomal protein L15